MNSTWILVSVYLIIILTKTKGNKVLFNYDFKLDIYIKTFSRSIIFQTKIYFCTY
jgi:hypothetical protein